MHYAVMSFQTDYAIRPDELALAAEARGFESIFFPEHTHIPTSRRTPYPAGGELPKEYSHTLDPFVALHGRGRRHHEAQGRHRHLPRHRARPDHHRQGGRERRLAVGRAPALRHRRRLEHRGDGEPRHRLQDALEAAARARAGDEGDLDQGRGRVPRRARRLRPDLVVAEARAEAAPADPHRRRRPERAPARRRLLRRLDADPGVHDEDIERGIADIRERAKVAGRDPRSIAVTVFWAPTDRAVIASWERAGVERVIFGLPAAERDAMLAKLDELARFVRSS